MHISDSEQNITQCGLKPAMPFKFFTIPIRDPTSAEVELNRFLESHNVLSIEKQLITVGLDSCWSVCVDYLPTHGDRQ